MHRLPAARQPVRIALVRDACTTMGDALRLPAKLTSSRSVTRVGRTLVVVLLLAGCSGPALSSAQAGKAESSGTLGHETVISEATHQELPGERVILGRVRDMRGGQIIVDIGELQPLYLPLKSTIEKGQSFQGGDHIIVTMNDHNAVVDYHHARDQARHQVIRGQLTTPLTVGWNKAVVRTEAGEQGFWIASRARGKLEVIPVGVEVIFLADETGQLVDAQLASEESVQRSAQNEQGSAHSKAPPKGAHTQVPAVYHSATADRIHVTLPSDGSKTDLPIRHPLRKLEQLKAGQEVVLLMDDDGYVLEIATPEIPVIP
jgi:hypothetical protein